jgi:uncharacterized membrane protein (DUF106 family)
LDLLGIEVTILAIAYVLASVSLQRRLANPRKTYKMQDDIKKLTKELTELTKNKAAQVQIDAKQKEITGLLSQSMKSQLKPMFVVLPLFLALYYLVFPMIIPGTPNVTLFSMTLGYKTYFVAAAFVIGLIISMSLMAYDKSKMKKEAAQMALQEGA